MDEHTHLSRRERQIMDVLYAKGEASVREVQQNLPNPPTATAVRRLLNILREKGHVHHRKKGREVIYKPIRARRQAGKAALERVLNTFFGGSAANALAAHLSDPKGDLSEEEIERLHQAIEQARRMEED